MANESWGIRGYARMMLRAIIYSNPTGTAKIRSIYALPDRPATIRKVLIVNDEPALLIKLEAVVRRVIGAAVLKIDPTNNVSIKQQVKRFIEEEAPDLILMDGNLGRPGSDRELTGKQLIHEMRAGGFKGYILANSSDPVMNWEMTENGADFAVNEGFNSRAKEKNLALFLKKHIIG